MRLNHFKSFFLWLGLPLLALPQAQAASVDLLVLYDSHSANYFNQQVETAMQNWVAQINNVYKDSNVDLQLRLVGAVAHEQAGADMSAVLTSLREDATAVSLRNQYGADFVTQLHQTGECGIGYMAVSAGWAWNVVGPDCGPLVMAHELGHNMGLNHSRKQGDTGGARYSYALGHGVDGLFGTVMTYSWLFVNKASGRVAKFSNPDVSCLGAPCGVAIGQPDEAHAAQALNNVKNELSAFRSTVVGSSSVSSSAISSSNISSSKMSSSRASSTPQTLSSSSRSSQAPVISSSRAASSMLVTSTSARSSIMTTSSRAVSSQVSSQVRSSSSIASGAGLAQCSYRIISQGGRSFSASIEITNTSTQVIDGWSVNWQYTDGTYLTYANGANVSGRNPYVAVNRASEARINPGQQARITLYGIKPRNSEGESPRIMGTICR